MLLGKHAIGTVAYLGGLPAVIEDFCWCWSQMVQYNAEILCNDDTRFIHYDRAKVSDHAPARNSLVSRFMGDWLVQLDTDHIFEADVVGRLIHTADHYGVDVLSGFYQMKSHPYCPVLFQWVGSDDEPLLQPMATWDNRLRLVQVGSAGGGCLFVRRSVFDRIQDKFNEGAFERIQPFSEDHSFFLRCKRLGIDAYAAPLIQCNHLRITPVTLDQMDTSAFTLSEQFEVKGYG